MPSALYRRIQSLASNQTAQRKRTLQFGAIYHTVYLNARNDRRPLIFILYSNQNITHAININYLNFSQKSYLSNFIYSLWYSNRIYNGIILYNLLKTQRHEINKTAYRKYHTRLLRPVRMVSYGINHFSKTPLYGSLNPFIRNLNQRLTPKGENIERFQKIGVQDAQTREMILQKAKKITKHIPIQQVNVKPKGVYNAKR